MTKHIKPKATWLYKFTIRKRPEVIVLFCISVDVHELKF